MAKDSPDFTLTIAKIGVVSDGKDIAVGCRVTGDATHSSAEELGQLTRAAREDGEQIHWDNPHHVTESASWKPAKCAAHSPTTGVTLGDGIFRTAMEKNIDYLLDSFSTDELLRQFYERTGKDHGLRAGR